MTFSLWISFCKIIKKSLRFVKRWLILAIKCVKLNKGSNRIPGSGYCTFVIMCNKKSLNALRGRIVRIFDFFKIVYDEVFILQLLAGAFSIVWVFYDWKRTARSIAIGIGYILAAFLISTLLNWMLFALSIVWRAVAGIHFQIAWFLTILLCLCIFDRTYVTSRFILGATVFITTITMAEFGHELSGYLRSVYRGFVYWEFVCFLADLLIVAFSFVIHRYTLKKYSDIPVVSVVLIMITTIVSTALIIVKTIMKMSAGMRFDAYYCIELAGIFIISLTSYLMIYYHCKIRKEKTILEVQNKLLEADKKMLIISEQAIEEMRSIRHDMKNQNKVMEIMLEEGRYDDLKEYFRSMEKSYTSSTFSGFINCGNQLVNSIVNMEILKANSYGITLVSKINIPAVLPFEPSDLCRVLVNLLDNAIEGILRTDGRDYLVDLKIGKRMDYLYISVQNEIREDADRESLLRMNTIKDDAVNHGYGHKIVKRIVEKYNGYVHYTIVENEFVAEVMLELKQEGKNEQRS